MKDVITMVKSLANAKIIRGNLLKSKKTKYQVYGKIDFYVFFMENRNIMILKFKMVLNNAVSAIK